MGSKLDNCSNIGACTSGFFKDISGINLDKKKFRSQCENNFQVQGLIWIKKKFTP